MEAYSPMLRDRPQTTTGRILVVDDDPPLLRALVRGLSNAGHEVVAADGGASALEQFEKGSFDVVVSDIAMPDLSGLELLRAVREKDLDLPVVLITGEPSVETAVQAFEYGAFHYLPKPISLEVLASRIETAIRVRAVARVRRNLAHLSEAPQHVSDRAGLEVCFDRALASLTLVHQPIVDWEARTVRGYEALLRTGEPMLAHPAAFIDAAERLNRVMDLGRAVRAACAREMPDTYLFINLHPDELRDELLASPESPLAPFAHRIVFEITERSRLERIPNVPEKVAAIKQAGYAVALDDIGAGYAGLTSFTLLEPDVVKLDLQLVRDLHLAPVKQKLVGTLIRFCADLGLLVVAEGVETTAERDTLLSLGCKTFQGYLFARPAPGFPVPNLDE